MIRKTKGLFHIKQEPDDHQSTNVSSTNRKSFENIKIPNIVKRIGLRCSKVNFEGHGPGRSPPLGPKLLAPDINGPSFSRPRKTSGATGPR